MSQTSWITLGEAEALLGGAARRVGPAELPLLRVHTDTRSLRAGDLFVALAGERFDGHDFLSQAKLAGASAALASRGLEEAGLPGLLVPDTLAALQQLARAWRLKQTGLGLIGVTGSNGKTTVTQMIASILRAAAGDSAWATAGNLNNHIGVPLTVLGLRQPHRLAVVELGMNHPGEIAVLADIALPTVALVNNAQREHQEFMGTVRAVAEENGSVLNALPADGVAVFPADDEFTPLWQALAGERAVLRFGQGGEISGEAHWQGDGWLLRLMTPEGSANVRLQVAGRHNLRNAQAACACALAAGVSLADVVTGLEAFRPVKGRSQLYALPHETAAGSGQAGSRTLVDDSYNANPDSVAAAIAVLADLPGPRWLLLGDMGEVGEQGPQFHAEAGQLAAKAGIEHLWFVGELSAHAAVAAEAARLATVSTTSALAAATPANQSGQSGQSGASQAAGLLEVRHFAQVQDALHNLTQQGAPEFVSVLVKGSRFMRMEQLVQALLSAAAGAANERTRHAS